MKTSAKSLYFADVFDLVFNHSFRQKYYAYFLTNQIETKLAVKKLYLRIFINDSRNDINLYISSEKLYYFSDERSEICQSGQSISRK
jgi:hypothetical protein